ncbi:MAG TPA: helix-turn-helix domain-containing protein [Ktedonobacteraceae bacterium]|nr:helix-turn-helix domain-containing protein [Ktedonobacteraceae bacterium]
MVKRANAPTGMYTAAEAAKRLGYPKTTFHNYVRDGKIKKIVPPGQTEGYYPRAEIEKLAQARELFILLHSTEHATFQRASSEEDIRGIYELCIAIYGIGGTPSYEERLRIWHKNPYVYYIIKQENIVVGYISLIWFTEDALKQLMGPTPKQSITTPAGTGVYSITGAENVLPFTPGQPIDSLFVSLGVRPGISNTEQRINSFKLLRDTITVLEEFTQQGMPVKKLYGTSEKLDGIRLARKLGMEETKYEGDSILRFELDLEKSNSPLLTEYQRITRERSQRVP